MYLATLPRFGGRVRADAGLRTLGWRYDQRGVVATVQTDAPNGTAWQRFLPAGPLALLPVRGGMSNIVWSTSPQQVEKQQDRNQQGSRCTFGGVMFQKRRPCCSTHVRLGNSHPGLSELGFGRRAGRSQASDRSSRLLGLHTIRHSVGWKDLLEL